MKVTAKMRKAIIADLKARVPQTEIVKKHGVARSTIDIIGRSARREGTLPTFRKVAVRPDSLTGRAAALASTHTVKQIAEALGSTPKTIRKLLRIRGLKAVPAGVAPAQVAAAPVEKPKAVAAPKLSKDEERARRIYLDKKVVELAPTHTVQQIADELGIYRTSVDIRLAKAGIKAVDGRHRFDVERLRELAPTHSAKEAAAEMGVTVGTIYQYAIAENIDLRKRWPRIESGETLTDRAVALAATHTIAQIARELGTTYGSVGSMLFKKGVKPVPGRPGRSPKAAPTPVETAPAGYDADTVRKAFPEFEPSAEPIEIPAFLNPRPAAIDVARHVLRDGFDSAMQRWPYLAESELRILAADGKGRLEALATPPAPPPPKPVFVKPDAALVAEVVARHGLEGARIKWPFLDPQELDDLADAGRPLITPPVDDLPQPWWTRVCRAVARFFRGV